MAKMRVVASSSWHLSLFNVMMQYFPRYYELRYKKFSTSIDLLKNAANDCLCNKQYVLFMRSPCPKHEDIQCNNVRMHYSFMHIFDIYEIVTNKISLREWFDKHHAENFFWEERTILKEEWMEHFLPKEIKPSPNSLKNIISLLTKKQIKKLYIVLNTIKLFVGYLK